MPTLPGHPSNLERLHPAVPSVPKQISSTRSAVCAVKALCP